MDPHADGTGLNDRTSRSCPAVPQRRAAPRARSVPLLLLGTICGVACVSLWPASRVTVSATPADVLACASAQAKQLGYHVGPDTTHGSLTAKRTLPSKDLGPDVTEYSRQDVLAVSARPVRATGGSTVTIQAETISVQGRGIADAPITASLEVRADADTVLARCRHAAPNTSLP
jgi:hypothetical protein